MTMRKLLEGEKTVYTQKWDADHLFQKTAATKTSKNGTKWVAEMFVDFWDCDESEICEFAAESAIIKWQISFRNLKNDADRAAFSNRISVRDLIDNMRKKTVVDPVTNADNAFAKMSETEKEEFLIRHGLK